MEYNLYFLRLITTFMLITLVGLTAIPVKAAEKAQHAVNKLTLFDAVNYTIRLQPGITLQEEEVNRSRGILQGSGGPFDWQLNSSLGLKQEFLPFLQDQATTSDEILTSYNLGLTKKLRTGITFNTYLNFLRTDERNSSTVSTNQGSVNFAVIVPLLKGWGRTVTEADEQAAELNLKASARDLQHTVSNYILQTITSYWNYVAASEQLRIEVDFADRATTFQSDIQELIKGGVRPARDIDHARANVEEKTVNRLTAEQLRIEAMYDMGMNMGIPVKDMATIPGVLDPLPATVGVQSLSAGSMHDFVSLALRNRADIMAAEKRKSAAMVQLQAARENLKPILNLNLNSSYTGINEGDSLDDVRHSFYENVEGVNYRVLMEYNYPFNNNTAEGTVISKETLYKQEVIKLNDLQRLVASRVIVAVKELGNVLKRVNKTQKAAAFYKKTITNEIEKMKVGMSTILDVFVVEDRYNLSLLNEVQELQNYAVALATLRYELGILVIEQQGAFKVTEETITAFPIIP